MCKDKKHKRRGIMDQCPKCQNTFLKEDAVFCPSCGCMTGNKIPREMLPDKANSAVAFLVFLISVFFSKGMFFGFTLWAAKTDITPKAARTYGLCAIIPWIIKWVIPAIIKAIITTIIVAIIVLLLIAAGVFAALYFNGIIVF